MSIKVEGESSADVVYPIAMQSIAGGYIVVFTSMNAGVVVGSGTGRVFGEHDEDWIAHTSRKHWIPVTITISSP